MMPPRSTLNASRLVRTVFAATPELPALSTLQIYQTALAKFPNEYDSGAPQPVVPRPPRRLRDTYEFKKQQKQQKKLKAEPVETPPVHVLQSIRFLKKYVLEDMADRHEVEKVIVRRKPSPDSASGPINVMKGSTTGRVFEVPLFTSEKRAWLWRLIPGSEWEDDPESPDGRKKNT